MRIFLSAGEQSGDLHGAAVARELLRLRPDAELLGLGGSRMESAGVSILYPLPRLALIGFIEVAKHLPQLSMVRRIVRRSWLRERPDVIVLIDFPGLHLRLARLAQSFRIPVVYYIAPQLWAWGENRVTALRNRVKRLLLILPFEERFFRRHNVDCVFVGHPLMDALADIEPRSYKPIVPEAATIGLLPGSRRGELSYMLPPMLDAAHRVRSIHERTTFVLSLAETLEESVLSRLRVPSWVEVVRDPGWKHRLRMDLAWTSSGTATVENAVIGVPMVIVYRTGRLNAMLARRLVRTPYIGLANLVAGYGVCPEFIQEQVRSETLAAWTLDFLEDQDRQRVMLEGLHRARKALGPQGASHRAAIEILQIAAGGDR
jgi:lipid-A-disaccharide synthase